MNKLWLLILCCLSLNGESEKFSFDTREYTVFSKLEFTWYWFDVYEVKLWTSDNEFPNYEKPLIMTYDYRRDIKAQDLIKTSEEEWAKLKLCGVTQSKLWADQLSKIWPDIKSGDSLTAWFDGEATHFYQKNKFLGSMPGKSFSKAFFQIWLHPKSQTAELRKRKT